MMSFLCIFHIIYLMYQLIDFILRFLLLWLGSWVSYVLEMTYLWFNIIQFQYYGVAVLSFVVGKGCAQRPLLRCLICTKAGPIWAQALIKYLDGGCIWLEAPCFHLLLRLHGQILETLSFILNQVAQFLIGKSILTLKWILRLFGSDHLRDFLFLHLKDFTLKNYILRCFGPLLFDGLILVYQGRALRRWLTSFFIFDLI